MFWQPLCCSRSGAEPMFSDSRKNGKREIPACSLCLVLAAFICHSSVLAGNWNTSYVLANLGTSTTGWSGVGLSVAGSVKDELSGLMADVTGQLVSSLETTLHIHESLDLFVSLVASPHSCVLASTNHRAVGAPFGSPETQTGTSRH